jgi:hypothetical protein
VINLVRALLSLFNTKGRDTNEPSVSLGRETLGDV